ncbi:uncharacterized protein LOC113139566 [Lates japonicus]
MKTPSVSLLLGVSVLLLSGLTVSAVISVLPPFSWIRLTCHLVVLIPYCISTLLMVSVHRNMMTAGRPPAVSMEMAQHVDEAQGLDEDYDDIGADVTTVYDL